MPWGRRGTNPKGGTRNGAQGPHRGNAFGTPRHSGRARGTACPTDRRRVAPAADPRTGGGDRGTSEPRATRRARRHRVVAGRRRQSPPGCLTPGRGTKLLLARVLHRRQRRLVRHRAGGREPVLVRQWVGAARRRPELSLPDVFDSRLVP